MSRMPCIHCGADTLTGQPMCQACASIHATIKQEMEKQFQQGMLTPATIQKAMQQVMANSGGPNTLIMSPQAMSSSYRVSQPPPPMVSVTASVLGSGWNNPFVDKDQEFLSKSKVPAPPKKENEKLKQVMESRRINAKWGP